MTYKPHPVTAIKPLPLIAWASSSRYNTRTMLLLGTLLLSSCCPPPTQKTLPVLVPEAPSTSSGHLTDYGEARLSPVANKLLSMDQSSHIIQLGDSHTAADFFTGSLRTALQQRYGNAGPGWLPPAWIRGQRSATLRPGDAAKHDWQLSNSRVQQHSNFPLGGVLVQPLQQGSRLQLTPYTPVDSRFNVRALYHSPAQVAVRLNGETVSLAASSGWQWSAPHSVHLPLKLEVLDHSYPYLGGWLLDNGQAGVLFSSLGLNGATINMLDKWGPDWPSTLQSLQPDLLILAYGTNEAFNDNLDSDAYYAHLTRHIQQLRRQQPQAALLIIGAPDAIKDVSAPNCQARRPTQLGNVQAIQRQVAREQQTLFWDWQAMMGGICSFSTWQARELAQKDGVHFTSAGYKTSANALYQDLEQYINQLSRN